MAWESVKKLLIGGASIDFTFNDSLLATLLPMNAQAYVMGGFNTVGYSCTLSTLIADIEHQTPDFHEYDIGDVGYKIGFGYQNSLVTRYIYDPITQNSFGYTGGYQYPQTGALGILPLINEDEEKGMFVMVTLHYPTTSSFIQFESVGDKNSSYYLTACYNAIKNSIPPAYNWQAVPSIVGKSAVSLDLSVILDINDGEAVTTSDASKFDLNNDSNVITLVNNVINQNE